MKSCSIVCLNLGKYWMFFRWSPQRLLPIEGANDLFFQPPPTVPTSKIYSIRPYLTEDEVSITCSLVSCFIQQLPCLSCGEWLQVRYCGYCKHLSLQYRIKPKYHLFTSTEGFAYRILLITLWVHYLWSCIKVDLQSFWSILLVQQFGPPVSFQMTFTFWSESYQKSSHTVCFLFLFCMCAFVHMYVNIKAAVYRYHKILIYYSIMNCICNKAEHTPYVQNIQLHILVHIIDAISHFIYTEFITHIKEFVFVSARMYNRWHTYQTGQVT